VVPPKRTSFNNNESGDFAQAMPTSRKAYLPIIGKKYDVEKTQGNDKGWGM